MLISNHLNGQRFVLCSTLATSLVKDCGHSERSDMGLRRRGRGLGGGGGAVEPHFLNFHVNSVSIHVV